MEPIALLPMSLADQDVSDHLDLAPSRLEMADHCFWLPAWEGQQGGRKEVREFHRPIGTLNHVCVCACVSPLPASVYINLLDNKVFYCYSPVAMTTWRRLNRA